MFIELVDTLRCPTPHEESWLVLAADRMAARHVLEGTLGCPVCDAEYPIREGVVDFRLAPHVPAARSRPADPEQAMRLAAFLGLDDALGFAVLMGEWGAHALELRGMVECPLILVDPPADVEATPGLSIIRTDGALPLAAGAARGMAIDAGGAGGAPDERIASAVRATRVKGRIVGPVSLPLPDGVRELARDDREWVGEREPAASPLVALHVRRGR
jgi:uncharacterized protein YbaR (Trm112 family)